MVVVNEHECENEQGVDAVYLNDPWIGKAIGPSVCEHTFSVIDAWRSYLPPVPPPDDEHCDKLHLKIGSCEYGPRDTVDKLQKELECANSLIADQNRTIAYLRGFVEACVPLSSYGMPNCETLFEQITNLQLRIANLELKTAGDKKSQMQQSTCDAGLDGVLNEDFQTTFIPTSAGGAIAEESDCVRGVRREHDVESCNDIQEGESSGNDDSALESAYKSDGDEGGVADGYACAGGGEKYFWAYGQNSDFEEVREELCAASTVSKKRVWKASQGSNSKDMSTRKTLEIPPVGIQLEGHQIKVRIVTDFNEYSLLYGTRTPFGFLMEHVCKQLGVERHRVTYKFWSEELKTTDTHESLRFDYADVIDMKVSDD